MDDDDLEPEVQLFARQGIPADARALGLDRNVPEGAWLAFAGSLNATRPAHRVVAWILLGVVSLPILELFKIIFS